MIQSFSIVPAGRDVFSRPPGTLSPANFHPSLRDFSVAKNQAQKMSLRWSFGIVALRFYKDSSPTGFEKLNLCHL
jgi:hypothetical protein